MGSMKLFIILKSKFCMCFSLAGLGCVCFPQPSFPFVSCLTEFHPRYNNEQTNLLVFALQGHTHETTVKLKIADVKNSLKLFESTTKLARTGSAWGTESGALNRFVFIFMCPKWTKTKTLIQITLSLQA